MPAADQAALMAALYAQTFAPLASAVRRRRRASCQQPAFSTASLGPKRSLSLSLSPPLSLSLLFSFTTSLRLKMRVPWTKKMAFSLSLSFSFSLTYNLCLKMGIGPQPLSLPLSCLQPVCVSTWESVQVRTRVHNLEKLPVQRPW